MPCPSDTAIIIASDHGNSYFKYLYYYILRSDDSFIETTYGTLFIVVPNYKEEKNKKLLNNININQQSLVSPYDIHDTIIHIGFGDNLDIKSNIYSHRGNSLLSEFNSLDRNCKTYDGDLALRKECLCEKKLE